MKRKKVVRDPIYVSILNFIKSKGPVHPHEVADLLNVTRQAVDYRLRVLEEEGLVLKELKEGKVYYKLTDKGETLLSSLYRRPPLSLRDRVKGILVKKANVVMLICFTVGLIGFIYFATTELNLLRGLLTLLAWLILGLIVRKLLI